jgi:hypothetical protein
MSPVAADALRETRSALDELDRLIGVGWRLARAPGAAAGELTGSGPPRELVGALTRVGVFFTTATLTGRFADAQLELTVLPDGTIAPNVTGSGDINDSFDVDDRRSARRAWGGDSDAAFSLPGGSWSATAQLRWTRAVDATTPSTQWLLFWKVDEVAAYVREQGFLRLKGALDSERGTVVLLRGVPADATVESPALMVASLEADRISIPVLCGPPEPAPADSDLAESMDPRLLLPSVVDDGLRSIADALCSAVVGSCWTRLATKVTIVPNGDVDVEYFGLQRVRHTMPAAGPAATLKQARSSVELLDWVESDGKIDRLIAARQVISLRTDEPPWVRPEDIEVAAEPIFRALRADAIAEALKSHREARTAALDAAQRSVQASGTIAKSTAEKAVAAVIAIGAILTGNTTNKLSADQASKLQLLVAATLVGLAFWNVIVERPALFRPINDFKADLRTVSDLLSKRDRKRIKKMTALKNANEYAVRVAVMVPMLYLVLAAAAVFIDR